MTKPFHVNVLYRTETVLRRPLCRPPYHQRAIVIDIPQPRYKGQYLVGVQNTLDGNTLEEITELKHSEEPKFRGIHIVGLEAAKDLADKMKYKDKFKGRADVGSFLFL